MLALTVAQILNATAIMLPQRFRTLHPRAMAPNPHVFQLPIRGQFVGMTMTSTPTSASIMVEIGV